VRGEQSFNQAISRIEWSTWQSRVTFFSSRIPSVARATPYGLLPQPSRLTHSRSRSRSYSANTPSRSAAASLCGVVVVSMG
jgi:hypothetical protein